MNYLLVILSLFIFTACSSKNYVIKDLKTYSQDPTTYETNTSSLDVKLQEEFDKEFNRKYFSPWHKEQLSNSKEDALWGFSYENKEVYFQNHQLIPKEWFSKQRSNSNFSNYGLSLQKAIVIKNSNLRVFPTREQIFYDPSKAGEGFPFDYNQNSGIKLNTPILISHYSKDMAWAYIEASHASGWILSSDIAKVDKKIRALIEYLPLYIAIQDDFKIYSNKGNYLHTIKLGTIFSKLEDSFLIVDSYDNKAFVKKVTIKKSKIEKKPILFNKENNSNIVSELINEPYGWGELQNKRDCSALTRDFVSVFGIYLNRNSKAQLANGRNYSLENLSNKEKKEFILKHAKPYLTLLYMKGHIALYIGQKAGEPLIFHNFWGIRTYGLLNSDSRHIIGKAAITSLEPGKELTWFIKEKSILSKITTMVNLDEKASSVKSSLTQK